MRRSNLVDAVDLIRADDAVLATGQGVAAMRATRRAAAEELARLSGVDRLAHDTPGFDLYAVPPTPSPDEGGEAIKQGRQVTRLDTRIVQAGRGVEGAETVVDPRLDLILAGTSEGAGEAADDGFSSTAADYTAALRFTWQLGSRSAKAAHQKAIMERNRLVALRDETIRSLDGAVRGIAVRLAGLEEVRAVDQNRIAAAEKRATAELERYRQGRSDYTYVIAAQDLVQQARLQYAADALLSQSLAYRYAALTDRLLAEGE
jgi:outer membrane protein TolC